MEKQSMEMLDIALLVLVMALAITLGFSVLYKAIRLVENSGDGYMADKNTGRDQGYLINEYGAYDGTLSQMEVVLVSQIQDENMPSPTKIKVNSLDVQIPFTYREYYYECAQNVWLMLMNQPRSSRYSLNYRFTTAPNGTISDQYFAIDKMN
ncbi:MAG: hypothetical protein K0R34_679 [Herbinix sp.]|jgi:hypothetical protein|nr:hypothetical protein [Herbinix sp.]